MPRYVWKLKKIDVIKQGTEIVGNHCRAKVVKNKVAPPFKQAEFDIMYGQGISREGGLIDIGLTMNIINKSGAWLSYGEERLGQGRENAKDFLKEHPETALELESKIRTMVQENSLLGAKSIGDATESALED